MGFRDRNPRFEQAYSGEIDMKEKESAREGLLRMLNKTLYPDGTPREAHDEEKLDESKRKASDGAFVD